MQDENKVLKCSVQQLDQSVALLRQNCNDLEQYSGRECVEITGIPPPVWGEENVNDMVLKIGKLMDVEIGKEDISVCHRLPISRSHDGRPNQQKIIKFVRREIKEKFYKSRRRPSVDLHLPSNTNFQYLTTHDFHSDYEIGECLKGKDCFAALHCNIRSLQANIDNFYNMFRGVHSSAGSQFQKHNSTIL